MRRFIKPRHGAVLASVAVLGAALLSGPPAAAAPNNSVMNTGTVPIGALRSLTGPHQHGTYDDLIPPGQRSGYPFTAGVYVGEGYCLRWRYVQDDGETGKPHLVQGPRTEELYSGNSYEMRALRKPNSLCEHL
jgi:hypothetical protein